MEFSTFVRYAEEIEAESGNNGKEDLISNLLLEADDDMGATARFIQGDIFPKWDDTKASIGPATMYEALSKASGTDRNKIEDLVAETGGIGEACEHLNFETSSGGQSTLNGQNSLGVSEVYDTLSDIANVSGSGSTDKKIQMLSRVLLQCETTTEAKYFSRIVLGEMRIGVGEATVRNAIVQAFDVDGGLARRGIMVTNDIGKVASVAQTHGDDGLKQLKMKLGRPIQAMLAQKGEQESAISEAGNDDGEVAVEIKYDGSRIQVHKKGGKVGLFTRNFENVTDSLPDVVDIIGDEVDAENVIIDGEVVAYEDKDGDKPLPFQEVMKRVGRKHDVEDMAEEIHVEVHIFDILYHNGEELIDRPFTERRELIETICPNISSTQWVVSDTDRLTDLEAEAIQGGHEGLMVKNLSATYNPGGRGKNWLKLKPALETLDCVVIGAEWGEGRRAHVFGTYKLAVLDEDGELVGVGKVATGITDEELEELHEMFEPIVKSEDGTEVTFMPEIVFEVGCEEIQPSPKYSSGYALRFPRFIRVRDEKAVDDAETVDRLERLAEEV